MNVAVTTWSQHTDGAFWRFFGCVLGAFEGGNSVSPLLPFYVQNCQREEAAIWQPTERTEKVKASTILSYIGIVDDRLNPPKSAVFPLTLLNLLWKSYTHGPTVMPVWTKVKVTKN